MHRVGPRHGYGPDRRFEISDRGDRGANVWELVPRKFTGSGWARLEQRIPWKRKRQCGNFSCGVKLFLFSATVARERWKPSTANLGELGSPLQVLFQYLRVCVIWTRGYLDTVLFVKHRRYRSGP